MHARRAVYSPSPLTDKCEVCDKPAQFECSRCGGPGYCSAVCQRQHWKDHAAECRKARGGRRSSSGAGGSMAASAEAAAAVAAAVSEA